MEIHKVLWKITIPPALLAMAVLALPYDTESPSDSPVVGQVVLDQIKNLVSDTGEQINRTIDDILGKSQNVREEWENSFPDGGVEKK